MSNNRALLQLIEILGLTTSANDYIEITGQDPVLDTPYLIGEALAGSLGAQAAAVTKIWKMRTTASNGNRVHDQRVSIDIRPL